MNIDEDITRSVRLNLLFGRNVVKENVVFVNKMFNNDKWDTFVYKLYCRRKCGHRLVISNVAIRVCRKMLAELDILVFPVAERLTTPYKDAGAWGWQMWTLGYPFYYGSAWSLKECARKDRVLVEAPFQEIIPETIKPTKATKAEV